MKFLSAFLRVPIRTIFLFSSSSNRFQRYSRKPRCSVLSLAVTHCYSYFNRFTFFSISCASESRVYSPSPPRHPCGRVSHFFFVSGAAVAFTSIFAPYARSPLFISVLFPRPTFRYVIAFINFRGKFLASASFGVFFKFAWILRAQPGSVARRSDR